MIEFDWSEWVILRFIGASFILWLCYYLLYDRKAAFNQCRKFLLFSVLLAMVVAVVRIPVYPKEIIPINDLQSIIHETQTNEISETKIEALGIQSDVPETVISEGGNEPAMPLEESPFYASWDYMQIAWSIYGIGVFILLLHLSIEIIRIKRLQRWGSCTTDTDGIHIVRNNNVSSPFSFYRTIFIHRKLEGEVLQVVVLHEKTHIFFHHYRDTFFIECMSVLFWFNPFVWLIKRELRALHEFQVDNSLLSSKIELFNYQRILFEELMGYSPKIANGFHNSLIKKRFIMMKHQYIQRFSKLRRIALFPLCIGLLALFSFTERSATDNLTADEVTVPIVPEKALDIKSETIPTPGNSGKEEGLTTDSFPQSTLKPFVTNESTKSDETQKTDSNKSETELQSITLEKTIHTTEKESEAETQSDNTNNEIGIDLRSDQLVVSRLSRRNHREAFVRFIECTSQDTRVTIALPVFYDRHWIQFEKGLSIVDENTQDIYRIRSLTRGMRLNQTYWIEGQKGRLVEFTMVFPPLSKKVKKISIRDCFPEENGITPPNGAGWNLNNLWVNEFAPTVARLAEYDKEGRPLRSDRVEEVNIPAGQLTIVPMNSVSTEIYKIETTDDHTEVTLSIPIYSDRHWICIGKDLGIVDEATGKVYQLEGITKGIELNKLSWIEGCKGRSILVTLLFPKLNKKVRKISLYEVYPDAGCISPTNSSPWDWRGIKIKNYQREQKGRIIL